jgi:hypothetical protein
LARVEAVYHLDNRGPERRLDLVFASGSERVSDFQVRLGEKALPSAPGKQSDLPAAWQPPKQTPGIHDDQGIGYLAYGRRKVTPLSFTAVLPPGPQTLRVSYEAEAAKHHYGRPTVYWQLAYVLAPAREWASFGGLEVTVRLPPDWLAACSPAMKRDGDVLRESFSTLPADAIALTVQAPVGTAYQPLVYGGQALLGLAGVSGAALCWWGGRSRGRIRRRAWPLAVLLGVAWGLTVFASGLLAVLWPGLAIPAFQGNNYGYGTAFAIVGVVILSVLAVPVGFAICMIAAASNRATRDPAHAPVADERVVPEKVP